MLRPVIDTAEFCAVMVPPALEMTLPTPPLFESATMVIGPVADTGPARVTLFPARTVACPNVARTEPVPWITRSLPPPSASDLAVPPVTSPATVTMPFARAVAVPPAPERSSPVPVIVSVLAEEKTSALPTPAPPVASKRPCTVRMPDAVT